MDTRLEQAVRQFESVTPHLDYYYDAAHLQHIDKSRTREALRTANRSTGQTPVQLAATVGNSEALYQLGIRVSLPVNLKNDHFEHVTEFIQEDARKSPSQLAVEQGHTQVAHQLALFDTSTASADEKKELKEISSLWSQLNPGFAYGYIARMIREGQKTEAIKTMVKNLIKNSPYVSRAAISGLKDLAIHLKHPVADFLLVKERSLQTRPHIIYQGSTFLLAITETKAVDSLVIAYDYKDFLTLDKDKNSGNEAANTFTVLLSAHPEAAIFWQIYCRLETLAILQYIAACENFDDALKRQLTAATLLATQTSLPAILLQYVQRHMTEPQHFTSAILNHLEMTKEDLIHAITSYLKNLHLFDLKIEMRDEGIIHVANELPRIHYTQVETIFQQFGITVAPRVTLDQAPKPKRETELEEQIAALAQYDAELNQDLSRKSYCDRRFFYWNGCHTFSLITCALAAGSLTATYLVFLPNAEREQVAVVAAATLVNATKSLSCAAYYHLGSLTSYCEPPYIQACDKACHDIVDANHLVTDISSSMNYVISPLIALTALPIAYRFLPGLYMKVVNFGEVAIKEISERASNSTQTLLQRFNDTRNNYLKTINANTSQLWQVKKAVRQMLADRKEELRTWQLPDARQTGNAFVSALKKGFKACWQARRQSPEVTASLLAPDELKMEALPSETKTPSARRSG